MKIHVVTAGMLCLVSLTTGACVTRTTYEAAIANLEATNVELYSTEPNRSCLSNESESSNNKRLSSLGKQRHPYSHFCTPNSRWKPSNNFRKSR